MLNSIRIGSQSGSIEGPGDMGLRTPGEYAIPPRPFVELVIAPSVGRNRADDWLSSIIGRHPSAGHHCGLRQSEVVLAGASLRKVYSIP